MKIYSVEIEIQDINDNPPTFLTEQTVLQVIENKALGSRFVMPEAHDPDLGKNSVQGYDVSFNKHFTLEVKEGEDGVKRAELVLEQSLDHEENVLHQLVLTARDGGDPGRSGTAQILVTVIDVNDNAPVFNQSVYKIKILENMPTGTVVTTIEATDKDHGVNSILTYSFTKIRENVILKFQLDSKTGEISLISPLDFEETERYEFEVQATDGESVSRCSVFVNVINVNDNRPEILISSLLSQVVENSPTGTTVALLEVYDRDSGEYGDVVCSIPPNLPFQLDKSLGNYYSLITDGLLDRECVSEYNITITAMDKGTPPLTKTKTISLKITDVNDNPPLFERISYAVHVSENTPPGTSIFTVKAIDQDWDLNGKIMYSIVDGHVGDVPLTSSISINSESGVIYALRSFDFEEFREFTIQVKAQDGGSPALMSNATVSFFILDQNDNTPEILYPSTPTDGSSGVEMAPRSSEPGYLITKVIAVDADSGQNAWLSYQLLRSTDQGLFTVGLQNGELRTARPIIEKDTMTHVLVVLVKDNGEPCLSSSVTVTIVLADSLPEVVADLGILSSPADIESNLTLYLVIAVSVVSFLFLFFVILLLVFRLHEWRQSEFSTSSLANVNALSTSHFVGLEGVRAFLQNYSHDACFTTDSRNNEINYPSDSHYSHTPLDNGVSQKERAVTVEDLLNVASDDQLLVQNMAVSRDGAVQVGWGCSISGWQL
ncbi:protocadherin gamma-A10-like [Lissotriton helveticus]